MSKRSLLILPLIMAVLSLIVIETGYAQSIPKPSVPEFTLRYVDYSYDVPPKTTSTTDPYTGKITTTTIPGRHVENKTIEAVIKNPSGATYFNFRYKGYYEEKWTYYPFSPSSSGYSLGDTFSVPYQASTSTYTVAAFPSYFVRSIPQGGQLDVQVQALYGGFRAVPYGHIIDVGGPTYDFYFEGETSDWSNTQTIKIDDATTPTTPASTMPPFQSTPTPNPTESITPQNPTLAPIQPNTQINIPLGLSWEQITIAGMVVIIVVLVFLVMFYRRRKVDMKCASAPC